MDKSKVKCQSCEKEYDSRESRCPNCNRVRITA